MAKKEPKRERAMTGAPGSNDDVTAAELTRQGLGAYDAKFAAMTPNVKPDPPPPEMQRDNGPTTEPIPNRRGTRTSPRPGEAPAKPQFRAKQAPPEVVARSPAPAPAAIAAGLGVGTQSPVDSVPRETQAPEQVAPEQDKHAFAYMKDVEAGVAEAMRRGRPDIAANIQQEYANLVAGQFRALEANYEIELLPQIHQMREQLVAYQGKALPRELAIKANDLALQAESQRRRMLAYAYGLERNAMTAGGGVSLFNQSKLIEPGVELAKVEVRGDMLVGLDANGNVVDFSNGTPFQIPVEQAETLYREEFESDRDDNMIVPKGAKVINRRSGATVATNEEGATTDERLSAIKVGTAALARRLGIELDATGRLMEGVDETTRQQWLELSAKIEQQILGGSPPQQAADDVWREHSAAAATQAAPAAAGYDGPRPWAR